MKFQNAGYMMCPLLSDPSKSDACAGRYCSMWRWYQIYDVGGYEGRLSEHFGYCGLAGPQPGYRVYKKQEQEAASELSK